MADRTTDLESCGELATDDAGNLLDMPRRLAHRVSHDLLDVLALLYAARTQAAACVDETDGDADGVHDASSRAVSLISIADERVRSIARAISPYV